MTKHLSGFCVASMVGCVLAGGSTGFGHGHSSHGSTHPAAAHAPAHHEAPKHSAAKPAHHSASKPQAKPKGHENHKLAGKPGASKQAPGKSNELGRAEQKSGGLVSGSQPHDKSHEHHHEHHHDHHHRHWNGHEWVDGVDVENGVVAGSVSDGTAGAVVSGDGSGSVLPAVVVPNVVGSGISKGPQIQFSVEPLERDNYEAAARAAGMSRSEWIRSRLNTAAGRELK